MQSTRSASMMFLRISPLARLVGGHGAVGQDEAGKTRRGQVMDEVLDPGEIGV